MLIKNNDFNLTHTFECGQCFRWNADENGVYTGVIYDKVVKIWQSEEGIFTDCDDTALLHDYFDLNRNYKAVKDKLSYDDILKKAVAYGYGIRILKQQPWETLISFIISANNNIPRIKKIIESLCENFGDKIGEHYTLPTADKLCGLAPSDLAVIRSGYRADYIINAAQMVSCGTVDLDAVHNMPSAEGRSCLKQIKGVGDKVADCVLLFAYNKHDVFPKDVWIKRILNNLYAVQESEFDAFTKEKFGDLGGFAQQYLFYYQRSVS